MRLRPSRWPRAIDTAVLVPTDSSSTGRTAAGAAMTLFNADGSPAEVSGNGVRCLAAIVAGMPVADRTGDTFDEIVIETGDGIKTLTLIEDAHPRYMFRAFMGEPKHLRELELDAAG